MGPENTQSFNAGLSNKKRKSTLKKSIQSHQCPVCDEIFSSKRVLKEHRIVHDKSLSKFTCQICDKGFLWPSQYKRHLESHEQTSQSQYKCQICDKVCKSYQTSNRHKIKHDKSLARYNCDVCGKVFFYETDLKSHMKKHDGYYDCTLCKKPLKSARALIDHTNSQHTKKFTFSCQICGLSFATKNYLRQHERSKKHLNKIGTKTVEKLAQETEELLFVRPTTEHEIVKTVESTSSIDNGYCSHESDRIMADNL